MGAHVMSYIVTLDYTHATLRTFKQRKQPRTINKQANKKQTNKQKTKKKEEEEEEEENNNKNNNNSNKEQWLR